MDKASTQTTAVVTALEIMRSVQPWPDATPENVAAVILFKRGIRFRASVAPTLADILPPFRVSRCSKTGDITVWQGPQEINWTVSEPEPIATDSAIMDITLPEDAARRILALYRNAVDELHDPPFDDVLTAIAAQHPGLVSEFGYLPWPTLDWRDNLKAGALKAGDMTVGRGPQEATPDATEPLQGEIMTTKISDLTVWPTKTDDLAVWQELREIPFDILKPSTIKRAYTQAELDAAVMAERERCAALVDPMGWESLHPSDGEYLVLEQAARKIRGD